MFFVMLNHPSPNIPALIMTHDNPDCDIYFFETEADARRVAKSSFLGSDFGFEIFELGTGGS